MINIIFEKTRIESLVINDTTARNFACGTQVSIPDKLKDLNNCFKYYKKTVMVLGNYRNLKIYYFL